MTVAVCSIAMGIFLQNCNVPWLDCCKIITRFYRKKVLILQKLCRANLLFKCSVKAHVLIGKTYRASSWHLSALKGDSPLHQFHPRRWNELVRVCARKRMHRTFRTLWRSRARHARRIENIFTSMACPRTPKIQKVLCSHKFPPPARAKLV